MNDNFEVKNQQLIKYERNETIVTIPENVKYIDSYAFFNIQAKRLVISNSAEYISENAVVSCGSLKEIVFPDLLLDVNQSMMIKCNQIKCIYANVGTVGE